DADRPVKPTEHQGLPVASAAPFYSHHLTAFRPLGAAFSCAFDLVGSAGNIPRVRPFTSMCTRRDTMEPRIPEMLLRIALVAAAGAVLLQTGCSVSSAEMRITQDNSDDPPPQDDEFRPMWVATAYN